MRVAERIRAATGHELSAIDMNVRRWLERKLWGKGRSVRYVFVHPTCGGTEVEAGYLPQWGRPRFLCRRCGVVFDEAAVRLAWQDEGADR